MDPLSVSASIIGILCAAAKVTSVLSSFVRNARGAPELARTVLDEVNGLSAILSQLQTYLLGAASASRSRVSLILVEQVIVTLAECVTTFSELEDVLEIGRIKNDLKIIDRIKWAMNESKVSDIQLRLQRNKTSLSLMLTILQCKSMEEAESAMVRLCNLVEQVLAKNEEMSLRLRNIDDAIARQVYSTQPNDDGEGSISSIGTVNPPYKLSINIGRAGKQPQLSFTFEEDLFATRVYRRPIIHKSGQSLMTSAARTTATASIISALSLSDISNISVFAIPVYAHEISNSDHYAFGGLCPSVHSDESHQQASTECAGLHPRLMMMEVATPGFSQEPNMEPDSSSSSSSSSSQLNLGDHSPEAKKMKRGFILLRHRTRYANAAIAMMDARGQKIIYSYIRWLLTTYVRLHCGGFHAGL